MKRLRLSYTLLSYWEKGQTDLAVAYYLKRPMEETDAMREGKEWGRKNEEEILKNRKFIKEFGGWSLNNPQAEKKFELSYNDIFDLVIVPDCIDGSVLYETKTGKRTPTSYLSEKQLPLYYLGLKMAGVAISDAYLIRFNQHEGKTDWAKKLIGEWVEEEARNYIDSLGPEIFSYFKSIDVL